MREFDIDDPWALFDILLKIVEQLGPQKNCRCMLVPVVSRRPNTACNSVTEKEGVMLEHLRELLFRKPDRPQIWSEVQKQDFMRMFEFFAKDQPRPDVEAASAKMKEVWPYASDATRDGWCQVFRALYPQPQKEKPKVKVGDFVRLRTKDTRYRNCYARVVPAMPDSPLEFQVDVGDHVFGAHREEIEVVP